MSTGVETRGMAPSPGAGHQLWSGESVLGLTEPELLDRFVASRDEAAFEVIVRRHGPMVMGVCRSVLVAGSDVDDAFQATFLVLVRKVGSLRDRKQLGPWLHGVARRVSLRARANRARGVARNLPIDDPSSLPDPSGRASAELAHDREVAALIHSEVDRLPAVERSALVLCDLEGMTHAQAADQLGWPIGTVKTRVGRARDRLKRRLTRRGVALSSAFVAGSVAADGAASASIFPSLATFGRPALPPDLAASTLRAALASFAPRALLESSLITSSASLALGEMKTMLAHQLIKVGAACLGIGSVAAISTAVAYQSAGDDAKKVATPAEKPDPGATPAGSRGGAAPGIAEPSQKPAVKSPGAGRPFAGTMGMMVAPGRSSGPGNDSSTANKLDEPRNEAIRRKLEEMVSMNFPNPTPLGDFVKYVKQSTSELGDQKPLPIYVDPQGLASGDRTMESTVTLDLEAIPLRTTLKLALDQLDLAYTVCDGLIVISTPDRLERFDPTYRRPGGLSDPAQGTGGGGGSGFQ